MNRSIASKLRFVQTKLIFFDEHLDDVQDGLYHAGLYLRATYGFLLYQEAENLTPELTSTVEDAFEEFMDVWSTHCPRSCIKG